MKAYLQMLKEKYGDGQIGYDAPYNFLEGWLVYAKNADTYKIRKKILADFERKFPNEISTKEVDRNLKIRKSRVYPPASVFECRQSIYPAKNNSPSLSSPSYSK